MTIRHRRIAAMGAAVATALLLPACSLLPKGQTPAPLTPESATSSPAAPGQTPTTEAPPPETPSPTPTTAPSSGDQEAATAALEKKAGTSAVSVVAVGKGFDGASLVDDTTIAFWVSDGEGWTKENTRTYVPTMDGRTANLAGTLLKGADHATFVLTGEFFHEARAVAFGYAARHGWSSYLAQPDGSLEPSNKDGDELRAKGMELGISFSDGRLVTLSIWGSATNAPYALQFSHPTSRTWVGDGERLTMVDSNISIAERAEIDPIPEKLPTPATRLRDGTWFVWVLETERSAAGGYLLTVQPLQGGYGECDGDLCVKRVGGPVTLSLADDTPTTITGSKDRIVTMTAPGWVFAMVAADTSSGEQFQGVFVPGAPYVLPTSVADEILPSMLFRITVEGRTITSADALYTT